MNIIKPLTRSDHVSNDPGITVIPSTDALGADIEGFDFEVLAPARIAALRAAWLAHGVVRFRGCHITDEQHIRLTAALGEFANHPRQLRGEEGTHDRYEEILVVGNAGRDGEIAGTMGNSAAR